MRNTRPDHVCGPFFAYVAAQQFFTIVILCPVTKIVAMAALLGCDTAILVTEFKAPPYFFTIARCRRLGQYQLATLAHCAISTNYHELSRTV